MWSAEGGKRGRSKEGGRGGKDEVKWEEREGRKVGRQVCWFSLSPTYSLTPTGLQMPKVSLALRLLTLVREIILKDYRSHTWNQNVTKLAARLE